MLFELLFEVEETGLLLEYLLITNDLSVDLTCLDCPDLILWIVAENVLEFLLY